MSSLAAHHENKVKHLRRGFLLLLIQTALGGCALLPTPDDSLRLWAVPDGVTVYPGLPAAPEQENEVFSASARLIRLGAAVNEVVSFQLVIDGNRGARVESVALEDLRSGEHVIAAVHAHLYRELPLKFTDYPSWYLRLTPHLRDQRGFPDVLVPLGSPRGALPIDVAPGSPAVLWGDIHVPVGSEAGTYSGALRVTLTGNRVQELGVSLEVRPFALPQTRHLAILAGLDTATLLRHHVEVNGRPYAPERLSFDDPAYPRAMATIDAAIRLLHQHRLTPVLRDVQPARRVSASGQMELDWSDYDRMTAGVIEGSAFEDRASAPAWPLPVSESDPRPEAHGGPRSPTYRHTLVAYLRACAARAADAGWMDRHFAWIAEPGSDLPTRYREFERLAQLAREADPRISMLCSLPPQPLAPWGLVADGHIDLGGLVGVWCPPASLLDPEALAGQRAAGKRTWFQPDRPPFSGSLAAIAPPVHALSVAWLAYRFGVDGVLIPSVNLWGEEEPNATDTAAKLVWPGKEYGLDGPVPSIRLKRLFRGAQDHEYLWLLERNDRDAIARAIAEDLVSFAGLRACGDNLLDARPNGWVSEPSAWSLARRLMARELTAAGENDRGVAGAPFDHQVEWLRLAQAVRQVTVEVEGSRLEIDEKDASRPVRVSASVVLHNATRSPVSGSVGISTLPPNWKVEPSTPLESLAPGQSARRLVHARAPLIMANSDGVFPLHVALDSGGRTWSGAGRIAALTSQRLKSGLTIDGRLDDWPLGSTNVASDFVLVGAQDVPKQHRASPDRPALPTTVFVTHDDAALYVAFNCEDPRLRERSITRSNDVRYDELWPTGEDLVEIVLDPASRGVDAGDLLHIVVKANGAVVTERGAPCLAAVARHETWPAGVVGAVDDSQPNRWTAEIRIPLASLPNRAGVMGVNFGRFQPRLGEYSSWSAARRHLYSPAALGNMRLAQ